MFGILGKSLSTGVVTTHYPDTPPEVSPNTRGHPEFDWENWKDARPAAAVCPTGALSHQDSDGQRNVCFDLARCTFCGLCAEVDSSIRMTRDCECAVRHRNDLIFSSRYQLNANGTQDCRLRQVSGALDGSIETHRQSLDLLGQQIKKRAHEIFGRSLHVREVDAGSCNGCEIEIAGLNSPVYDVERFGIHFVASPRHADMLLVTGPVTRNMELALKKTYDATPDPRLVVAVGACGCSGGIFGVNYATRGAVDAVIPVDVYVPGCPPNPHALLHGILLATNRLMNRP